MLLFQWVLAITLIQLSQVTGESNMNRLVRPRLTRDVNTSEDCKSCSCGVGSSNRIVGGTDTDIGRYPWVTMFFKYGHFECGGSLINNKYVLTAAHCVHQSEVLQYEVHFLRNRLDSTLRITIVRKISRVINHPNFNNTNNDNDISLLQLNESVQFNGQLNPVCLPSETDSFEGQNGIVVGWGIEGENAWLPSQLQEVTLPIITLQQCRDYPLEVTENMICAMVQEGGKDACKGDSGGPLHVIINSKYILAGIVSWGKGCARPNSPGGYTKVSNYVTWIRENTADACYC